MEYQYKNNEEKLLHIISTNGTAYEEYLEGIQNVDNINFTDANDRGFLHEAVLNKKTEIANDLMRRGINVDLQDVNGYTAAMYMVVGKQWDLLQHYLKYNPNLNLMEWTFGKNILSFIASDRSNEAIQMAKELLKAGANPYSQDRKGKTPLDLAIKISNTGMAECFLQIKKTGQEQKPEEKFRVPRKASGIYPINVKDYRKYILVEGTSVDYLIGKIYSYAEICGGKKKPYQIKLSMIEHTDWVLITCPAQMDFYNYHNLMSWFWGVSEDIETPKHNICVALHKDERCSYYGVIEDLKYGDRIVGRFQNGESFSIYLPEAYKKNGNAKSYSDILPIKSIRQYLQQCGFEENLISDYTSLPSREVEVEMAVE